MPFRAAVLASTVLLTLASPAQQPAKRPMTFADLQAMKRVSDPQISPSGKWVLFSVTDVSLEKNSKVNHLWIVPLDGSAKEKQVTTGDGESNGRFAPDGHAIALTMKDQIYTMAFNDATGTLGQPTQITHVNGGADGAVWSPDSKRLLFTIDTFPECSDLGDWAKEDACNAAKQKAADASPVKAQVFTHLLYRHWDHFTGDRRSHIAVVDATGEHLRDLTPRSAVGDAETPTFSLGGPLGYAWAPDSHEIAYETNLEVGLPNAGQYPQPGESTNNDIFTLKLDAPNAKAVKVSSSSGSDDGPQYSPDGKYLAWRSQARNGYESDKFDLAMMDRATGKIANITQKFDRWIDEFTWSNEGTILFFTAANRGQEELYSLHVNSGKIYLRNTGSELSSPVFAMQSPLPRGIRIAGDSVIVATSMRVDRPAEIVVIPPSDSVAVGVGHKSDPEIDGSNASSANNLTHLNDRLLAQLDMSKQESFWFPGANNTKVQGFLIRPPHFDSHKKYPVKFLIHGGPQGAWGDAWSYRWNPELFAADGYVVVMINPRGSTGYGQRFLEEVSGDWGGRPFTDLMRGLDYAEQHYPFIDRNRECALGASYGGFMADYILTHTNRFKCIVTHDGMYNPQSAFGTTEELWFNEWEFRQLANPSAPHKGLSSFRAAGEPASSTSAADAVVEQAHPAHPWDFYNLPASEDPFRKFSPLLAIKNAHTPTLVVHSQRDFRLDVSEGYQLFTALQLLGVPSKMLYFPDEGHWVLKPQNSQLWYATVNDWCDRWLGMGKYAAAGPEHNPAAAKAGK